MALIFSKAVLSVSVIMMLLIYCDYETACRKSFCKPYILYACFSNEKFASFRYTNYICYICRDCSLESSIYNTSACRHNANGLHKYQKRFEENIYFSKLWLITTELSVCLTAKAKMIILSINNTSSNELFENPQLCKF